MFNYFHQFTREPWRIDKIILPAENKKIKSSPKRSFESLIMEAESYDMPYDVAMKAAYDNNDPVNARLDFRDYLMFMKSNNERYFKFQIGELGDEEP